MLENAIWSKGYMENKSTSEILAEVRVHKAEIDELCRGTRRAETERFENEHKDPELVAQVHIAEGKCLEACQPFQDKLDRFLKEYDQRLEMWTSYYGANPVAQHEAIQRMKETGMFVDKCEPAAMNIPLDDNTLNTRKMKKDINVIKQMSADYKYVEDDCSDVHLPYVMRKHGFDYDAIHKATEFGEQMSAKVASPTLDPRTPNITEKACVAKYKYDRVSKEESERAWYILATPAERAAACAANEIVFSQSPTDIKMRKPKRIHVPAVKVLNPEAPRDARDVLLEANLVHFYEEASSKGLMLPRVHVRESSIPDFFTGPVHAKLMEKGARGIIVLDINPAWKFDLMKYEATPYEMAHYVNHFFIRPWRLTGMMADVVCVRVRHPWNMMREFLVGNDGILPEYDWLSTIQATPFRDKEGVDRLQHPNADVSLHGTYYYHIMGRKALGFPVKQRRIMIWKPQKEWVQIYWPHVAVDPDSWDS